MRPIQILAVVALLGCALAGCRRDAPDVPAEAPVDIASTEAVAPPAAEPPQQPLAERVLPPPPLPEGTQASYSCDDGNEIDVTYTHVVALLHWPDGREAQLSRAASASKGGGDVYVGDKVSLQRNGGSIQLLDGNAPATQCNESSTTG